MTLTEAPREVHNVIGGDVRDARQFGLTLVAKCGLVFVPKYTMRQAAAMGLPECEDCHDGLPHRLPIDPHVVYRCYNAGGRLIYVGCTGMVQQRLDQHRISSWWWPQVARTRVLVFPNKDYALWQERIAIGEENPRWNIKGRQRALWAVEDYADLLCALRQNGASLARQNKVIDEAHRRFDVDLNEIEVAA